MKGVAVGDSFVLTYKTKTMRKFKINVPKGINYLSEWKNFRLFDFPYILDKKLTGCGFTSWILSNNQNVILCSPRRALLESKLQAYLDDLAEIREKNLPELNYKLYYAKNDYENSYGIDRDLTKESQDAFNKKLEEEIERNNQLSAEYTKEFKKNVRKFYLSCEDTPFSDAKFCKIIVTYDSFRKVKEALESEGVFDKFHVIIDEFQSIFTDSRFKSNTEMELLKHLDDIDKLCYVSATPMIESYLDQLDEFKSLPFIELNWAKLDPSRVLKPKLEVTPCTNINRKVKEIIEKYKNNTWKESDNNIIRKINEEGKIEEFSSKEAVFYINSVKNICDIIRSNNLTQEECNVICADTESNSEQLRKAFKVRKDKFQGIGRVPGRRETNKMFTFCTRTVYLGADFYSTNARSFVFSDANIDTLAVDITLDLPQILGRQRLDENPWKNSAIIYYKPLKNFNIKDKKQFDSIIERKRQSTDALLRVFNEASRDSDKFELALNYEYIAKTANYKSNYVAVNRHSGSTLIPKFNQLVMLSEIRAFEIQQLDYADRFSVRSTINNQFGLKEDSRISIALIRYETYTNFEDKMRFLCDVIEKSNFSKDIIDSILIRVDEEIANHIRVLGVDKIKSNSYRRYKIDKEVKKLINNQRVGDEDLNQLIYSNFKLGDKFSKSDIKKNLQGLYDSINLIRTAKASDLNDWFEIKVCKVRDDQNKRVEGFEILKKK